MSTYLQLCQSTRLECDIAGSGPATVVSQSGELEKIVKWVADEYTKIQNRHNGNWRWLRSTATVSTTASDDTYAYSDFTDTGTASAISRFKRWRINDPQDPPKIYLTASGSGVERWLCYTPWQTFKSVYKIGTQNNGPPAHITVDPNDNIVVGPAPDDVYTITLDYIKSPQTLAADSDEPEMPAHFHLLIQYQAMIRYGYQDAAPEVIEDARMEARRMLRQLENEQLPQFRKGKALA